MQDIARLYRLIVTGVGLDGPEIASVPSRPVFEIEKLRTSVFRSDYQAFRGMTYHFSHL